MSLRCLYDSGETIYRVLAEHDVEVLVIDCLKKTMPFWIQKDQINGYLQIDEKVLHENSGIRPVEEDTLSKSALSVAHKRYSIIAPIVSVISDKKKRDAMIAYVAKEHSISKQTIRKYLCLYLVYQSITVLASKESINEVWLTTEQKWMRWALNKYFYTQRQNSLRTVFLYLLKEKYTDENGLLKKDHPSFYQFRYFYRKTRNEQNFLISRKGLTEYQRNYRPLLGEGIAEFANHVGVAMLDSTICDIYLVDEKGTLFGRPILTACVDAYSQLCCGFALTWQGGMDSLRALMENVIIDKVAYCKQYGVIIGKSEWDCGQLPGVMVTDRGMEFCSENFEQLSELGVTIINLPSYRPELKGIVEKFFDLVQSYYKPYLKSKGVIETDHQQRGAHDYRLDACLTLEDFQKVILRCIVHYNSKRKLSNISYTQDMLDKGIKPYPTELWNYGMKQAGANLIMVEKETLEMVLLPRTTGQFSRRGLIVNGLRYKKDGYTEYYLKGEKCVVSYNPDDVSNVYLVENGKYIKFELIESRYRNKTLTEIESIQSSIKNLKSVDEDQIIQSEIDLSSHITAIGETAKQIHKKASGAESNV